MPVAEAIIDAALEYDYDRSVALFRRLRRELFGVTRVWVGPFPEPLQTDRDYFLRPRQSRGGMGKQGGGFWTGGFVGGVVEISIFTWKFFPLPRPRAGDHLAPARGARGARDASVLR
jgi:hypothetical protein